MSFDFQRGFIRLTIVASVLTGVLAVVCTPSPSLDGFRRRPATWREQAAAQKWLEDEKKRGDFSMPSPGTNESETYWTASGAGVLKENQAILPLEFSMRYYLLPFIVGVLGAWVIYAILRFVVFGYIVQGFKRRLR
jgi:hypothetical protein